MLLYVCLVPHLGHLLINNCVSCFLSSNNHSYELFYTLCLVTVRKILKATLHVKMSHLNKIKVVVNCLQWQQFDVNYLKVRER